MFQVDKDTFRLNGLNFDGCHFSGKERIFRIIFVVSSRIRGAVDVESGSEKTVGIVSDAVFRDTLAHFGDEIKIECRRHDIFRCIAHGGRSQNNRGCITLGSVFVDGSRKSDRAYRMGNVECVINEIRHLFIRCLGYQLIPHGIIVIDTHQIDQLKSVIGFSFRQFRYIRPKCFFVFFH